MDHLRISVEANDASWRERCNERIERLKNTQFSSLDSASHVTTRLLQEKLFVDKKFMSLKLYQSVFNKNADEFVDQLVKIVTERRLSLSVIFDQVTCAGDSLLHVAVRFGADDIAELICTHSAELLLMKRDINGNTALHVAAREKNSNAVKLILSQYAALSSLEHEDNKLTRITNENGDTPLHEAVHSDDFEAVFLLFHADKSVAHRLNKSRRSPLYMAVQTSKCTSIIDLFLEASFVDNSLPSGHGISPLHAAISERNSALLIHILENNEEVMYLRDEDGGTPLHYAASNGYLEGVCELLLRSPNLALEWDKEGHLPIHLACKMGLVQVVEEFLKQEWPDVRDMFTQQGQNILHIAAKNGRNKVVEHLLLDKSRLDKFVINGKDKKGNTALHLASMRFHHRTLKLLSKDDRVALNIKNHDDLTAYDIIWLKSKGPLELPQVLSHAILLSAGAVRNETQRKYYRRHKVSPNEKWINDGVNIAILVTMLIATVTYAAGITVPGGVYNSDKPDSELGGFSVLAHRAMFKMFMICNTFAMYSSTYASIALLSAQFGGLRLVQNYIFEVLMVMGLALVAMSLAFMAATRLVVSDVHWLANLVTIIAAICMHYIVAVYTLSVIVVSSRLYPMSKSMSRLVLLLFDILYRRAIIDIEEHSNSQQLEMDEDKDNQQTFQQNVTTLI